MNSKANIYKAISNMLLFTFYFLIYLYFYIEQNENITFIMSFVHTNRICLNYHNIVIAIFHFFLDIEQIQCSGEFILPKCICSYHHVSNRIYHKYTACPFNSRKDNLNFMKCM